MAASATYRRGVEILLWLAPAAVVTCVTMLWVAWWGREDRGRPVDSETAARRLGEALERAQRRAPRRTVPVSERERSTGVAIRSPRRRPVVIDGTGEGPSDAAPGSGSRQGSTGADRRAS